jgi:hypothetical protein
MNIDIQFNIDQVINQISSFEKKGQDLSPLFVDIAGELLLVAEEAFEKEHSAVDDSLVGWGRFFFVAKKAEFDKNIILQRYQVMLSLTRPTRLCSKGVLHYSIPIIGIAG